MESSRAEIIYPAFGQGADEGEQHRDPSSSGLVATSGPLVSTQPEALAQCWPGVFTASGRTCQSNGSWDQAPTRPQIIIVFPIENNAKIQSSKSIQYAKLHLNLNKNNTH